MVMSINTHFGTYLYMLMDANIRGSKHFKESILKPGELLC